MIRWFSSRRLQPVDDEIPSSPVEGIPTGVAPISDEELLRRFVVERDDRAFAELVGRHGGMVLGVCRRVLGTPHDAEDAFQAVFLVLARKADTLRRAGSLPAWLHKTAFRTALRARSVRGRRREQTSEDLDMIAAETFGDIASEHDRSIVDEELNALPERYRLPLFLCCVEGKSLDVAARQLGWSTGSVKGRLERGRQELRRRLLLRRVPFALGFVAVAALAPTAQAATSVVAPSLIAATVQAGMQYAVGRSALGYVSQNAMHLAQGSWNVMSLTATKIAVGIVTAAGLAVVGAGRLPSPAVAGGSGNGGIVIDASFAGPTDGEFSTLFALADEPRREGAKEGDAPRREGAKEGDAPRREGVKEGPRDGDVKKGPRDGEVRKEGARDGDVKKEGARDGEVKKPGARDGDAPRREGEQPKKVRPDGEQGNPLADFEPQTEREKQLYGMILQLQREMGMLRKMAATRDGDFKKDAPKDGAAFKKDAPKEGAVFKKDAPKEGAFKKDAPKEGAAVKKDAPKEGTFKKDAPKKDGDAPKKDDGAPKKE